MDEILLGLNFDMEDVELLKDKLNKYSFNNFKNIILLLKKYEISNSFIREIILNKDYIFDYSIDRIEFILESIKANNDIIEEIILDLI